MYGPEQKVLIITAIIAIIGSFVPIFFGPIANFIFTKPFVIFEYSNVESNKPIKNVTIQNFGQGPAHNITLFVESSKGKIMNLVNMFSTSDILYNNNTIDINQKLLINKTVLELEIPKLTQGFGSQVNFQLELEKNSTMLFEGSAVFSEGSVILERNMGNSLLTFANYWYHHYTGILVFILIVIGIMGSAIALDIRNKRINIEKTITKEVTGLINDIVEKRHLILLKPKEPIWNVTNPTTNNLLKNTLSCTVGYGLINKYYSILELRNNLLMKDIDSPQVIVLNTQIDDLSTKIFDINWIELIK